MIKLYKAYLAWYDTPKVSNKSQIKSSHKWLCPLIISTILSEYPKQKFPMQPED